MPNATSSLTDIKPLAVTLTIESGQTTSDALVLGSATPACIQLPAAFTGTLFYIQVSIDGGVSFKRIVDQDGTDRSYTVTVDKIYYLDPAIFVGVDQIKIESDSSEGAERLIKTKSVGV